MSTPSIGFPPPVPAAANAAHAANHPVRPTVKPSADAVATEETKAPTEMSSSASTRRAQQNAEILQASMEVSIKSADSSLALLYRTAIDRINLELEAELGPDAIGNAAAPVQTPEATAGRILSLSTGFYDAYAAQHKDKDPETLARNFVDLIRGGFERGFGEARDILSGLDVLGEDSPIEQGINKTYALVMQGLDDFLASKIKPNTTEKPTDAPATNATDKPIDQPENPPLASANNKPA